jgi:hypothetical protein
MDRHLARIKAGSRKAVVACLLSVAFGCATAPPHAEHLPPLLTQDELLRPYQKVAAMQVQRERYGFSDDVAPVDYNWAYDALRHEAARIGADAVILPEVSIVKQLFTFWPTSDMVAKGIAIKFR